MFAIAAVLALRSLADAEAVRDARQFAALDAGAAGYLLKDAGPQELARGDPGDWPGRDAITVRTIGPRGEVCRASVVVSD